MNKKILMLIIGIGVVYAGIIFIVFLVNSRQQTKAAPLPVPAPMKIQAPVQEEKAKPVEPEIEYEPKVEQGPLLR